ncbi:MAG: ligase-associated DNA damage response endonuclease PdeM [Paracoccaceae bacterium]|nr:ligase-associated DNA damage response endonuclease PdeM [Paracoccaceae bacterium]MDG1738025.1 ligase-associated DNA damage response endonuclease PdeM [Paracoccaceae bacterium]MDG2258910.1 ligase-associated DNA damage response endonuclease PdeM [Paracoccaceae bacterium]
MSSVALTLEGETINARASGALFWPARSVLCVSDLHLGRSERIAREGGHIIPPYENTDTLQRLEDEIRALSPATIICLGDSFDDLAATKSLTEIETDWITRLQAGCEWIWIEGNHDPAPLDLGGTHRETLRIGALTFRHIADGQTTGEISGHYHPKASIQTRSRTVSRACFLFDTSRLIMPAFGTYTGGMKTSKPPLSTMFGKDAQVVLTGKSARRFDLHPSKRSSKPAASRSG